MTELRDSTGLVKIALTCKQQMMITNSYYGRLWLLGGVEIYFSGGGLPASQPHNPPESCLCLALRASCSEAAFCRRSNSTSFSSASIACNFCRSSATSTCRQ